jgi:hypothetical protein
MFSTCIFCNRPLGANEMVETFPVGRRLAFDGSKGRLWVVCRRCERWNLTPMDERWEAIEECERLFANTRLRMSTDNIGLAKLQEGLELVRLGAPQRPEFAAWRYGDQFGKRRKRAIIIGASLGVGTAAVFAGMAAAGVGAVYVAQLPGFIANLRVAARFQTSGRKLKVRRSDLDKLKFRAGDGEDGWTLRVKHTKGEAIFSGAEAVRVTGLLMPKVNHSGGSKKVVQRAVGQIEDIGDPERYLSSAIRSAIDKPVWPKRNQGAVIKLPAPTKLAIEMALHEEQERRALAGELLELEAAWRQAEEIASIADNLLVPDEAEQFIAQHGEPAEGVEGLPDSRVVR